MAGFILARLETLSTVHCAEGYYDSFAIMETCLLEAIGTLMVFCTMNDPQTFLSMLSDAELVQWDELLLAGATESEAQATIRPDYVDGRLRVDFLRGVFRPATTDDTLDFASDRGAYRVQSDLRQILILAQSVTPLRYESRFPASFGSLRVVWRGSGFELQLYPQAEPLSESIWSREDAFAFLCGCYPVGVHTSHNRQVFVCLSDDGPGTVYSWSKSKSFRVEARSLSELLAPTKHSRGTSSGAFLSPSPETLHLRASTLVDQLRSSSQISPTWGLQSPTPPKLGQWRQSIPSMAQFETELCHVAKWPHIAAYWLHIHYYLQNTEALAVCLSESAEQRHPAVTAVHDAIRAGGIENTRTSGYWQLSSDEREDWQRLRPELFMITAASLKAIELSRPQSIAVPAPETKGKAPQLSPTLVRLADWLSEHKGTPQRELLAKVSKHWALLLKGEDMDRVGVMLRKAIKSPKLAAERDAFLRSIAE